jgi:hypothetical protein
MTRTQLLTADLSTLSTVVGIPTRNEAATVAAVARTADAGLREAFPGGRNAVVLADNGSTDGTVDRFRATPLASDRHVLESGSAGTGKGTNVFALMDHAAAVGADRLVLLDGDVRSTEPAWVGRLARAVDGDRPTLAVPVYRRNRFEANSTNHLVRPLLAAVYGTHLQQPIGGEFAFNRAFLRAAREWPRPASAALYGIDVWLSGNALREGLRVVEVPLGRKLHNSPFPKILSLPQQVLDALFAVAARSGAVRASAPPLPVPHEAVDTVATRQDPAVVARITAAVLDYLAAYRAEVVAALPSARGADPAPWGLWIDTDRWPHLLVDALERVGEGRAEEARDHLLALFVNRVFTFWAEIDGLDSEGIDGLLDRVAADTASIARSRGVTFTAPPPAGPFSPGRWAGRQ